MPSPPAAPRRRISGEGLLFAVLLILHVAPVWAFRFMPTQDGPGHQALAFILRQYGRPDAGLLRHYYVLNREALPNWFIFFLLTRVLRFLAVPVAEKVLLTAYAALLPLSVRYALRGVDRRAGFLAVLAFPFIYNYTLHMGFFNFCFSLPAFFFTVGYWLRHGERMTPLRTAALALLVLWVYFCHPVTLVMAAAALLTLTGWRLFLERRTAPAGSLWTGARHWLLAPVLAFLPAVILMAAFVGRRIGSKIDFLPLWDKVKHLAGLYSLASLSHWTPPLAAALALLFYVVAFLCLRQRGRRPPEVRDGLLLVVLVFLAAYFLAPSEISGGGFVNHRLNLFPFLALILWLGAFDHSAKRRRWIQIVAACLAVLFLFVYARAYVLIGRGLAEIAAAGERIEPDHTFLYLSYAHRGEQPNGRELAFRTAPYLHAGGYVAAEKRLVDLSLYEANEDYFPIYYRPALNPYRHLSVGLLGIEQSPPRAEILAYPQRTGGRVDYVLIWGLRQERLGDPDVRKVLDQLAVGYDVVWTGAEGGVTLYRAR
ncbi:MAG TPA: hypothetical protein VIA62_27250 [Thermoanaerobaculia bacterium]|jgi:hypothetical protein|nr:hypothetical protein [Thermoanaerobaculia bacterium]